MDVVHSTLDEACSPCSDGSDVVLASRLTRAARLIFELYLDVLPVHHRDALASFPQQSALALTNCMFLSHQCVTLGMQYKARLPPPLNEQFFTFADLVFKVGQNSLALISILIMLNH